MESLQNSHFAPAPAQNEADPPPSHAAPPLPAYAGFWKRAGALGVDISIVYFLMAATLYAVAPAVNILENRGTIPLSQFEAFGEFLSSFIFLVYHWLYYALLESSKRQATIGKRLFHIRVTDLEGRPISFIRASFRNLGKILSDFTFWVGFFMAGFSSRKQALHDYLAGCVVVDGG